MRIDKFWINEFKNLKDVSIDFDQNHWITVVIGWNGTGKSNVLEALLTLFRDLVLGENGKGKKNFPSFGYKLRYKIRGKWVNIHADPEAGYRINIEDSRKSNGGASNVSTSKFFQERDEFLPEYIFGYYSGESKRFANLFEKYTLKYDKKLRSGDDPGPKKLFYALPVHSNFVLLSFILNETALTKKFLSQQLGLESEGIDSVLFILREPPWKSKSGDSRFWYARGVVSEFLAKIYDISLAPLRLTRRIDQTLWNKEYKEFLYLYVKDLEALKKTAVGLTPRQYFQNLESTYVSELIEEVRIKVKLRRNDGSITFKELSEGEQQLLTVLGLLRFTAEEESLFLLDEPDTHLNPRWSVDYLKLLEDFVSKESGKDNSHIILTTHNPLAVAELVKEQVQILKRNKDNLKITAHSPEINPRGMGYAGVITSDMFGLDAAVDSHTQGLLEEKRVISTKKSLNKNEKNRLHQINGELEGLGFRYEVRDPVFTEFLKLRYQDKALKSQKRELSQESKKKIKTLIKNTLQEVLKDGGEK